MTRRERYELLLRTASDYERKGKIAEAVTSLNEAERFCPGDDEKLHLDLWRKRLIGEQKKSRAAKRKR